MKGSVCRPRLDLLTTSSPSIRRPRNHLRGVCSIISLLGYVVHPRQQTDEPCRLQPCHTFQSSCAVGYLLIRCAPNKNQGFALAVMQREQSLRVRQNRTLRLRSACIHMMLGQRGNDGRKGFDEESCRKPEQGLCCAY